MKPFVVCISGHSIETFYDYKNYITIGTEAKKQQEIYNILTTYDTWIQSGYNIFNNYPLTK
jgi:hypothetical protein